MAADLNKRADGRLRRGNEAAEDGWDVDGKGSRGRLLQGRPFGSRGRLRRERRLRRWEVEIYVGGFAEGTGADG